MDGGKRRSKAFHFAMAAVEAHGEAQGAAQGAAAKIPHRRLRSFPQTSCGELVLQLEQHRAAFPAGSSRDLPLTRLSGFECNARWIVRRR